LEVYFKKFKENPPVSPINILHQLKPHIEYKSKTIEIENDIQYTLILGDDKFDAIGKSKNSAKINAYKKAVRFFSNDKNIIFF
jgi:hypothetical protein